MTPRRLWLASALLLLAPALAGLAADKDSYGDPLPEGAKARLGTARMRLITYSAPLLTPDGKTLYAQTNTGLLRLDPATGAVQGKVPGTVYGTPTVLSADGKRAANASYDRVTVWDTESGKALIKVERRLPSSDAPAALSADGSTLAIGGTGDRTKQEQVTVLVWDVNADKEVKKVAVKQNEYVNVALAADGKTLATWGSYYDPDAKGPPDPETNPSRFVTFWSAADGKELAKFRSAGYTPGAVAFAPDGALAAVANGNSSIDLVDPKTGASKFLLLGRSRTGRWLSFSPDGATLAATADDGSVQRWKVADGSRLSTTEPPTPGLYNARVRAADAGRAVAWASKGSVTVVWEVPSGKLLSPLGGHTATVRGVAVTPDNKFVLTSGEDGTTLKWELATGKPAGAVTFRQPGAGFGGFVPSAVFSPDVSRALLRDAGGGLGVHDVATGAQQYVIPAPYDGASYAAFSPDGSKVVVASSSYDAKKTPAHVSVWDVAAAKRVAAVDLPGVGAVGAALTPDGKYLVTAARKPAEKGNGEFVVTAWEAATGAKKGEFAEEAGFTQAFVAAAADNKTAAVVTSKGRVAAFDLATGKLGREYDTNRRPPALAPVFSPDGKRMAVALQADYSAQQVAAILVFDWATGEIKHTLGAPGGSPGAMAFSPDGKWLVTGSPDTTATVWDVSK